MDGERRILPVGKEGELLVHEDDLQGGTGLLDLVALDADYDADMEETCLLYTSPSPRDRTRSRMPSSA